MKNLITILLLFACSMASAQSTFTFTGVTPSAAIHQTGGTLVVSKKSFNFASGKDISCINCSLVVLDGCYFGDQPNDYGVYILNCPNVTVKNCLFANNGTSLYIVGCNGSINVHSNGYLNNTSSVFIPHAIQFDNCAGTIKVDSNYMRNFWGYNNIEDQISLYQSNGSSGNPILVQDNFVNGGGPSPSATGMIAGDGGHSSYQSFLRNKIANPQYIGLEVVDGNFIVVDHNQVFEARNSISNIGMSVQDSYGDTCKNITFTNNKINWTKNDGTTNNYWNSGQCSNVIFDGTNTFGQTLASMNIPDHFFSISDDTLAHIINSGKSYARAYLNSKYGSTYTTLPVANAGATQNITTTSGSLNACGSSGANGLHYTWFQVRGPNTASISNVNNASPTISGLITGSYHFRLQVGDNGNGFGIDTAYDFAWVDVNVAIAGGGGGGGATPPTANAGPDQTITLPASSVTLSGTGAYFTPATSMSPNWSFVSGPAGSIITSAGSFTTGITNLVTPGTYIFKLSVTDNNPLTSTDNVTIVVKPQGPLVSAGPNQTTTVPGPVTLPGTATLYTPATSVGTWHYTQVSGPNTATITNANAQTATVSGMIAGVYLFKLIVIDNLGDTGIATVTITANNPPGPACSPCTYILTSKIAVSKQAAYVFGRSIIDTLPLCKPPTVLTSNVTITLPTTSVMLKVTATGNNGSGINSYNWQDTANTAAITNAASATPTVGNLMQPGNYFFKVTVKDSCGLMTNQIVTVTVLPAVAITITNVVLIKTTGFWKFKRFTITVYYSDRSTKTLSGLKSYNWNAVTKKLTYS